MVTVLRKRGLRVVIYLDDHEPAHVHVYGDGECKITLGDPGEQPHLLYEVGASFAESRRAPRVVRQHHEELRCRWSDIHG